VEVTVWYAAATIPELISAIDAGKTLIKYLGTGPKITHNNDTSTNGHPNGTIVVPAGVKLWLDKDAKLRGNGTFLIEAGGTLINEMKEKVWNNSAGTNTIRLVLELGAIAFEEFGGTPWIGDTDAKISVTQGSLNFQATGISVPFGSVVTVNGDYTMNPTDTLQLAGKLEVNGTLTIPDGTILKGTATGSINVATGGVFHNNTGSDGQNIWINVVDNFKIVLNEGSQATVGAYPMVGGPDADITLGDDAVLTLQKSQVTVAGDVTINSPLSLDWPSFETLFLRSGLDLRGANNGVTLTLPAGTKMIGHSMNGIKIIDELPEGVCFTWNGTAWVSDLVQFNFEDSGTPVTMGANDYIKVRKDDGQVLKPATGGYYRVEAGANYTVTLYVKDTTLAGVFIEHDAMYTGNNADWGGSKTLTVDLTQVVAAEVSGTANLAALIAAINTNSSGYDGITDVTFAGTSDNNTGVDVTVPNGVTLTLAEDAEVTGVNYKIYVSGGATVTNLAGAGFWGTGSNPPQIILQAGASWKQETGLVKIDTGSLTISRETVLLKSPSEAKVTGDVSIDNLVISNSTVTVQSNAALTLAGTVNRTNNHSKIVGEEGAVLSFAAGTTFSGHDSPAFTADTTYTWVSGSWVPIP
jgi:hypothetical protein